MIKQCVCGQKLKDTCAAPQKLPDVSSINLTSPNFVSACIPVYTDTLSLHNCIIDIPGRRKLINVKGQIRDFSSGAALENA